jgi:hypothetical protein
MVQDLFGVRQMTTLSHSAQMENRRELVEIKQRELVRLAKLKGTCDEAVLKRQILLARSKLFREYAVELIKLKPGSQTPGIDEEIYDKEDEGSYELLAEYLRKVTYHPNQYKASAIKRV